MISNQSITRKNKGKEPSRETNVPKKGRYQRRANVQGVLKCHRDSFSQIDGTRVGGEGKTSLRHFQNSGINETRPEHSFDQRSKSTLELKRKEAHKEERGDYVGRFSK